MVSLRPGARVTTPTRRGVGVVLRHHPTLPAWVVAFPQDHALPLAWLDELLEVTR